MSKELSQVAKRRTKLIYESFQEEPDDREMLFQSAALCHVFFPRKEAAPDEIYQTESGRFRLYIMPMPITNPVTHELEYLGLPYGSKARIILANLNSIALQKKSRIIDVSDGNLTQFVRDMGLTDGGNQIASARNQIARLSSCVIRMTYDEDGRQRNANVPIVSGFTLFPDDDPSQMLVWPDEIELSELYYKNLVDHAVPLPRLHLAALSNNVTGIDLYCFLAHRLHRIPHGKPQFLTWKTIKDQFGREYTRMTDFRTNFKRTWSLVKSLYTDARVEEKGTKGLLFYHSAPPIAKKLIIK